MTSRWLSCCLLPSCSWTLVESRNKALVWFLNESYDDRMVAVLKDSVDVPILYKYKKCQKLFFILTLNFKKNYVVHHPFKGLKQVFFVPN